MGSDVVSIPIVLQNILGVNNDRNAHLYLYIFSTEFTIHIAQMVFLIALIVADYNTLRKLDVWIMNMQFPSGV